MGTRPTTKRVQELCASINSADLRRVERRLIHALERDRSGSAAPDGFRTGHTGSAVLLTLADDAEGEAAGTLSYSDPTGGAAASRIDGRHPDIVRVHVERAFAYLEQAEAALVALGDRLDLIDNLAGAAPEPPQCESCARARRSADMAQFSDVGGRLDRLLRLCQWCYDVIRRSHEAGARLSIGDALDVERVVAYHEGRRQRERIGSPTRQR